MKTILHSRQFQVVLERLCHQLVENHNDFSQTVLIGVQPRGILLSDQIYLYLTQKLKLKNINYGKLDISFYRDDFNTSGELRVPDSTQIDFEIEGKNVILIDDVLFTGRTIRSAMDALIDFGRPQKIELLVLIDRRFDRQVPIQPDYKGLCVDTVASQKVKVKWSDKGNEVTVVNETKA